MKSGLRYVPNGQKPEESFGMSYVSEPVWRWGELKSSPLRRRWSFTVSPVISTPSKSCANAGKSWPQKLSRHIHFVLSISLPSLPITIPGFAV